ncbi:hypothetical protein [Magnetospirillum sp. UT-4]|uniref:hypothetical protein n=1 Tax=Magnetospirillum sp. UT-4 TaxID=2681467 RepID=UPI00137C7CDE|nr:hypothetical protein [Magnetospirillum sp. UT-4]CAA7624464.1 conserved hypothetical protein [Magnetospirillum sp. UT-4]
MSPPGAVGAAVRERLLHRLRALMARTVANGATPEEELSAARMAAKVSAQIDTMDGVAVERGSGPEWARAERESESYQRALERNTAETLLKAAVQELALEHVNRVAPPRKRLPGEVVERVGIHDLLEPYLGMMLAANSSRVGRALLRQTIDELVYEGALPPWMDVPAQR